MSLKSVFPMPDSDSRGGRSGPSLVPVWLEEGLASHGDYVAEALTPAWLKELAASGSLPKLPSVRTASVYSLEEHIHNMGVAAFTPLNDYQLRLLTKQMFGESTDVRLRAVFIDEFSPGYPLAGSKTDVMSPSSLKATPLNGIVEVRSENGEGEPRSFIRYIPPLSVAPVDIPTGLPQFAGNSTVVREFSPAQFSPGAQYRYRPERKLTEAFYARSYPSDERSGTVNTVLRPVLRISGSGRPGHISSPLDLSPVDIANFARSYPKLKRDMIGASSGLVETLAESAMMVPLLLTKKVRAILNFLAKTSTGKVASSYLAYELAIKPAWESALKAAGIRIEDLQTFQNSGFSVYRLRPGNGDVSYEVQPVLGSVEINYLQNLVRSHDNATTMATALQATPDEVVRNCGLGEDIIVVSDYSLTTHLGDVLGMSELEEFIFKHGGHVATLAWNLSPVSFFTDWFTHIYKSLAADIDLRQSEHLFMGTYSNKLTVIEPSMGGNPPQVSNMFYRKFFDPVSTPAANFENAYRDWEKSQFQWRLGIVTAIVASALGTK